MAGKQRGANGRYIRTLDSAERDAEACRLRSRGVGYRAIADQLGYYDGREAYRGVQRVLAETVAEPAAELRALEVMKLDAMERAVLEVLERNHVTINDGQVVHLNGKPIEDDGPVLQAVDRLLKIAERRAKLLGLDAPKRLEVITLDAIDAEIARLTAELEQRLAAELDSLDAGQAGAPPGAAPA